jgi:hypothetical protein
MTRIANPLGGYLTAGERVRTSREKHNRINSHSKTRGRTPPMQAGGKSALAFPTQLLRAKLDLAEAIRRR